VPGILGVNSLNQSLARWSRALGPRGGGDERAMVLWRVQFFALAALALRIVLIGSLWVIQPDLHSRVLTSLITTSLITASVVLVARLGYERLSGGLLIGGLAGLAALLAFRAGGLRSPGTVAFFYLPLLAAVLYGARAAIITGLGCGSVTLFLVAAESFGWLAPSNSVYHPLALFILFGSHGTYMLLVIATAIGDGYRHLQAAQQSERERLALEAGLRQAQKMEALGILAGGVAHDFNNLLGVICGYADLMMEECGPGHPMRQGLETISKAGARGVELVKSIKQYSGLHESRKAPLKLEPLLAEVLGQLKMNLPAAVRTELDCAPGLPPVNADDGQMHQVLMNLGVNAGHAMGAAGGLLRVSAQSIDLTGQRDGARQARYVQLLVGDTGTGIAPETLEKIFDPFFSTKGGNGTGLGLSIVQGIVRDHGGQISVHSVLGQGTEFRILLPAA
jgi:signal transduction histidine kinase